MRAASLPSPPPPSSSCQLPPQDTPVSSLPGSHLNTMFTMSGHQCSSRAAVRLCVCGGGEGGGMNTMLTEG